MVHKFQAITHQMKRTYQNIDYGAAKAHREPEAQKYPSNQNVRSYLKKLKYKGIGPLFFKLLSLIYIVLYRIDGLERTRQHAQKYLLQLLELTP